jgi:multiple sugar transport system substrate-binding protein
MPKMSRRAAAKLGLVAAGAGIARRAAAQETSLKIVWMGWPDNQVDPLMQAFEKENPRVKLSVEKIPFVQLFQTLEVRFQARTPEPDIFICDSPLTASYAARGHLMDLTPHLDRSRFTSAALQASTWNGKLYSAPFGSSMQLLFYNKAMFATAGVEPPSADPAKRWTWEKLVEVARRFTDPARNQFGFSFEQSERPYQLLPLGQSLGGKALSDDGFKATGFIDSQPFVDAYSFMQKLYTEWKVAPQGMFDPNLPIEAFGTGRVAMLLAGTFHMDTLKRTYPNLDYAVAPHPYFERGKPVTPTGAWHIGVNPRTQKSEAALGFIKAMMGEEMQALWFKLRPYPPVVQSMWTREAATFASDGWKIARHELDHTAIPRPATPGFREYEDLVRVALRDIQTGADVKTTLTAAAQKIDREMQKYRT